MHHWFLGQASVVLMLRSQLHIQRGNVTATTAYILTNGSVPDCGSSPSQCLTGYAQYDIAGNVVRAIDARGYATDFNFADCFGAPNGEAHTNTAPSELSSQGKSSYAFATAVTNAKNQVVYMQFDYYLGRPVDAEDSNGTTYSGYSDSDPLDRPTKVIRAVNDSTIKSQSTFAYNDTARTVTVTSDQSSYGDNLLKGMTLYDGLGRATETRTYENSTQYIAVQHVPFGTLQDPDTSAWVAAAQSSNPFRPLSETPVWTTSFSDALGRTTKVRTPDSAIARTSYSGNSVTVSDQISKARKSVSDALGRLTQVYEDPSSANWLTSYQYDALNDLTSVSQYDSVSQHTQTRTFVYDSLKRLLSATNPESGMVCYGTLSGGQCQANGYDANGNLLYKTDARSITTTLAYDELNRPTSKSYNDSNPQTPTVNYFYDAQSLPSGAPSFTRGSATGRLVAVTYGGGSAGDYFAYDGLGRNNLKIQQTGGINYQTSAVFNRASAPTLETYPSVHTVNYNYDGAGRLGDKDSTHLAFTGTLGDGRHAHLLDRHHVQRLRFT
jgi:YD repeat-containing protein